MARSEASWEIPLPYDQVVAGLLSEDVQLALMRLRPDIIDARMERHSTGFTLHIHTFGRTTTGAIHRARSHRAAILHTWEAPTLRWQLSGPRKFILRGALTLKDLGTRTQFTSIREVEVPIPLVGGAIERVVLREFERDEPLWRQTLLQHLRGAPPWPS